MAKKRKGKSITLKFKGKKEGLRFMAQMTAPKTPECDKLQEAQAFSQKIGEFLDWLGQEKGVFLAHEHEWVDEEPTSGSIFKEPGDPGYETVKIKRSGTFPYSYQIEKLLAEFFEIDLDKVEEEKRAILEHMRACNAD